MADPFFHDAAERLVRGPPEIHADHKIVALIAQPVGLGILGVEHLEVYARERRLGFDDKATQAAEAAARGVHLDGFEVGKHHRAVVGARLLLPEEEFSCARLERIVAALENAADDDLRELVDEEGRDGDLAAGENLQVAGFQRRRALQSPEERGQNAVVVAGIRVLDGLQLRRGRVPARIFHERLVQRDLVRPGFFGGPDLRAHQVGAQEIVGNGKPSPVLSLEQVKTRIAPEILRNGVFPLKFNGLTICDF
ncbi:MAG: hypothetical protein E6H62_12510 [Betaproteobacteria bacterium]|nr:MAG: hypothetical protein E6H62_12510 [Betaproteobacteria bacterium]